MATAVVTKEMVEEYLPNPLKRSGNELRTWLESSRSRAHVALNLDKGVFYDFHTNRGGSIISLLRQFGAPISKELAKSESWRAYQFQLSILKGLKSQGRTMGCGRHTAVWQDKETKAPRMVARVMCLRWNCSRCAPFLKRVWTERLSGIHFGAIYLIPKGYTGIGRALDRTKRKAKGWGLNFQWLLLQANDYQILFVDSKSSQETTNWLQDEVYFEQVALMPTWSERLDWLEKGLETMSQAMHGKNKVRHSRGLFGSSDGSKAGDTAGESEAFPSPNYESEKHTQVKPTTGEHKYERVIVPYPIEEVVVGLERQGYLVQWCSEEGLVAFVIPSRNGPT